MLWPRVVLCSGGVMLCMGSVRKILNFTMMNIYMYK